MLKRIIQRMKNLWRLSAYEITPGIYEVKSNLKFTKKYAEIIYKDNLKDIL